MGSQQKSAPRRLATATCVALIAAAVGSSGHEVRAVEQLERYFNTSWRNAQIARQDWSDCTQQALQELLERVPRDRFAGIFEQPRTDDRRELNRTVWRTIQRWRRLRRYGSLEVDRHCHNQAEHNPERTAQLHEYRDLLASAMRQLSPRQQNILCGWSDGQSISDLAKRLGMSRARVSDEKYKALCKLRRMLSSHDC
jgi:RNA polymerase sigma factor (sigma-70 family)